MIYPINYHLTFIPDLAQFIYLAKEVLTFEIKEPTDRLELDCIDLAIKSCHLIQSKQMKQLKFQTDKLKQKLIVFLPDRLVPGTYKIIIDFKGSINDKLAGFYRSSYEIEGEVKYLASTQFEATDARRAFPCVDHPSFKATFDIAFVVDRHLMVISNTLPVAKEDLPDGKRRVRFERTPIMSTYLVYFGVGQFETKTVKYHDVLIRGITKPGHSQYASFALECTQKFLDYFETYFGVAYPLKKLDLIAIPDFASGAMENWGAITFRENTLLYYPGKSSKATKQRIAEVVSHELAHQWFGNLVTMKWWDDLWLNESFATYMAHKAMDHFWPEWKVWTDYIETSYFEGMALDGLESSHPIKVQVKNTHEMNELFDEIAYDKGGSILRMLDIYLTEPVFQKGLQKYIKSYSFKNAEASNLWNSLEITSKKPVVNIMEGFIRKVGFPFIKLSGTPSSLSILQSKFLFNGRRINDEWVIPAVFQTGNNVKVRQFIKDSTSSITLNPQNRFINANYQYSGFYITKYDNNLLQLLGKNRAALTANDVIGIIHDLFSLCYAFKEDLNVFLEFIDTYFIREQDTQVLSYLIGKLYRLFLLTHNKKAKEQCLLMANKAFDLIGIEPKPSESIHTIQLRNIAIRANSYFNDKITVRHVLSWFGDFLKNPKMVSTDLWMVVFTGAVEADKANYQKVIKLYEKASSQEEKVKLLSALGYSRDTELLQKTLEYSLSSKVRFINSMYPIASVSSNPLGRSLAFFWLMENWKELVSRTGGHSTTLLRRILKLVIPEGALNNEKTARLFLLKHPVAGLERTYKQILEELEINERFVKKYKLS